MKLFVAIVACALVGCDLQLPSQRVAEAASRHDQIGTHMTSNDVYRLLGPPQFVDKQGLHHWKTVGVSTNNFAELTLGFNAQGKIWSLHNECALK
jgi:hypothetical protein